MPAWRPFLPGMADGRDVTELQASLIALAGLAGLYPALRAARLAPAEALRII